MNKKSLKYLQHQWPVPIPLPLHKTVVVGTNLSKGSIRLGWNLINQNVTMKTKKKIGDESSCYKMAARMYSPHQICGTSLWGHQGGGKPMEDVCWPVGCSPPPDSACYLT